MVHWKARPDNMLIPTKILHPNVDVCHFHSLYILCSSSHQSCLDGGWELVPARLVCVMALGAGLEVRVHKHLSLFLGYSCKR